MPRNWRSGGTSSCGRMLLRELVEAALEPVFEDVGHGDQPGRALGAEGLGGGAGASPAAADQGNGDGLILARVAPRGGGTVKGRAGRRGAGRGPEEVAPRGRGIGLGLGTGLHGNPPVLKSS